MSVDTSGKSDATREFEEEELCTQCMTGNRPGVHFCRECGAPLSSYAATGPFESLFAEGHVYRKAAEHPHRFIVVVGIWLIFGSLAWAGALMTAMSWNSGYRFGMLVGIGLVSISMALIAKTTKNYCKRRTPLEL